MDFPKEAHKPEESRMIGSHEALSTRKEVYDMTTKVRKPTEIQQAVVFRCTDKKTGKVLGYGVKSDSNEQTYYVTYNYAQHCYECSCPACKECKHLRAVKEVVAERKQYQEAAQPAASYDVLAEAVQVVVDAEQAAIDAALDEFYAVRSYTMRFADGRESFESEPAVWVPQYKLAGDWYTFSERGQDVEFSTEQEADAYRRGVAGETRSVRKDGKLSREAYEAIFDPNGLNFI